MEEFLSFEVALELPREKRVKLYEQLADKAVEIAPTVEEFQMLPDKEQAATLCLHTESYERSARDGYRVEAVSLPKLYKNPNRNDEMWEDFATEVEEALNALREDGREITHFECFKEHGVLIVGCREPNRTVNQQVQIVRASLKDLKAQFEKAVDSTAQYAGALATISETILGSFDEFPPSDEELRSIVDYEIDALGPSDPLDFLEFIQKEQKEHKDTCTTTGCLISRILETTKDAILNRLDNLN